MMQKLEQAILCLLTCLCAAVYSNDSTSNSDSVWFHVATWPSHSEVRLFEKPSARILNPPNTPWVVQVAKDSLLIPVYIHKSGYQDTLLQVKLRPHATDNYVFVRLQPETDSTRLNAQHAYDRKRMRHRIGRHLLWSTLFPAFLAGAWSLKAQHEYSLAEDYRNQSNASILTQSPQWSVLQSQWRTHRDLGDQNKKTAQISAGIALSVLMMGVAFQF